MNQKTIDWNQASERGLIARINTEILHPLGLAMMRQPADGSSPGLLVSEGAEPFSYAPGHEASGDELFTFLMTAATDDALGTWVDAESHQMPEPANADEARAAFADLLTRAKAAGIYPLKA